MSKRRTTPAAVPIAAPPTPRIAGVVSPRRGALFSGAHVVTEAVTRLDLAVGLQTLVECERARLPA